MRFAWIMKKGSNRRYVWIDGLEDVDEVSPELYMKATYFASVCFNLRERIPIESLRNIIARRKTEEFFSTFPGVDCPIKLRKVLRTVGKKEQEHLLNGFSFNDKEFDAFLLFAGRQGFSFSQYCYRRGVDKCFEGKVPAIIDTTDDEVYTVGKTDLSEGALRTIVKQDKRIIAQFLTKGNRWICFYRTHKGLSGEETGGREGNHPHMHFISCDYGNITKEKIIEDIRKGKTPTNGYHVRMERLVKYGRII